MFANFLKEPFIGLLNPCKALFLGVGRMQFVQTRWDYVAASCLSVLVDTECGI